MKVFKVILILAIVVFIVSPAFAADEEYDSFWVMENVYMGMPWNLDEWVEKFGSYEQYDPKSGNPKIVQMFYFESIDMSLLVNINKEEIVTWRNGKVED